MNNRRLDCEEAGGLTIARGLREQEAVRGQSAGASSMHSSKQVSIYILLSQSGAGLTTFPTGIYNNRRLDNNE